MMSTSSKLRFQQKHPSTKRRTLLLPSVYFFQYMLWWQILFDQIVSTKTLGLRCRSCIRQISGRYITKQHRQFLSSSSTSSFEQPQHVTSSIPQRFCDLTLPEGRCIGFHLPTTSTTRRQHQQPCLDEHHPLLSTTLHPEELAYGCDNIVSPKTRTSFWMGRYALRHALASAVESRTSNKSHSSTTTVSPAILKDPNTGRPQLPPGWLGSISHKDAAAVALVQPLLSGSKSNNMNTTTVGIDLERKYHENPTLLQRLANKVLTQRERTAVLLDRSSDCSLTLVCVCV